MNFKKIFLLLHRYVGLATAVVLIIIAISGCVYSFQKQIRSVLYPHFIYVDPDTIHEKQDIDSLVRSATIAYPQSAIREIIVDADPSKSVRVYTWDLHLLYLNPYNAQVIGIQNQKKDPFLLAWSIHTQLGMGKFGGHIVALATLLCVPLIISGLVLWWPKRKSSFRNVLRSSHWRSWKSINYNLHNIGGFYTSIILMLVVLSGLMMSYVWFKDSVYFITGSEPVVKVAPQATPGPTTEEPINTAVDYVRKNYPEFQECSINYPYGKDTGVFTFRVNHHDKVGTTHHLHFNLSNGHLVKAKPYSQFSTGDRINAINFNIHSGKVLGMPGLIIVFLVTLFSAFLAVSGFIIWFNKKMKKNKKNKKRIVLSIIVLMLGSNFGFAQEKEESSIKIAQENLTEVVVTATRTPKLKADVPIPIITVNGKEVRDRGMMRLEEVLAEQTGLQLYTDNLANGIQMQGLEAKYSLILIDGEPLIGRIDGILDLSRVNVANIERIEIIKGPSSSLYGSDALAGVINIITKTPPIGYSGGAAIRYGTHNTREINVDGGYKNKKFTSLLQLNKSGIDGYNRRIGDKEKVVPPIFGHNVMLKTKYQFAPNTDAQINLRYLDQIYDKDYALPFGKPEVLRAVHSHEIKRDISLLPTITHEFSKRNKSTLRLNKTWYRNNSTINIKENDSLYNTDYFDQDFAKAELQHDFELMTNFTLTGGLGYQIEGLKAVRYDGDKDFVSQYSYGQADWKPLKDMSILAGARFDRHNAYGSQFSPKLAVGYNFNKYINVTSSVARGFKAPDFRELYLNFIDPNYGYSVFGSKEAVFRYNQLHSQDVIGEVYINPADLKELDAERALSYNIGLSSNPIKGLQVSVNGFYNKLDNNIETVLMARKKDGKAIYSYSNQQKVNIKGMDADLGYKLNRWFFKVGGQYLKSENEEQVAKLKEGGHYFTKDPVTGEKREVSLNEYGGLLNRSKYTSNASISYTDLKTGISGTIRWMYRSKYGLADKDRNGILNGNDEYAKGYSLLNASLSKTFLQQSLRAQVTANNLTDYHNTDNLALPGRLLYLGLYYQLSK